MRKINFARKSFLIILIIIVCANKSIVNAETFMLSKDKPKATAIVSSNDFEVRLDPGSIDQYDPYPGKSFTLIIGENCNFEIDASKSGTIDYSKHKKPDVKATNPNKVKVASDKIKILGSSSSSFDLLCSPNFKEFPDDKSKFLITFELKGIDPEKFDLPLVLSSDDDLYVGPTENEEQKTSGLESWKLAAIITGCVILLLLIASSVIGSIVYCVCKCRKKAKDQTTQKTEVKTGVSAEDGILSKQMQEPKKKEKVKKKDKVKKPSSNLAEEEIGDRHKTEVQTRPLPEVIEDSGKQVAASKKAQALSTALQKESQATRKLSQTELKAAPKDSEARRKESLTQKKSQAMSKKNRKASKDFQLPEVTAEEYRMVDYVPKSTDGEEELRDLLLKIHALKNAEKAENEAKMKAAIAKKEEEAKHQPK